MTMSDQLENHRTTIVDRACGLSLPLSLALLLAMVLAPAAHAAAQAAAQAATQAIAQAAQWPDYRIAATIDPAMHRLAADVTVTVPAAAAGQTLEFVLAGNLAVDRSSPAVEKLPAAAGDEAFSGINGTSEETARRRGVSRYRVTLPAGASSFSLHYSGLVDMQPEVSAQEYARSFAETPGIVDPRACTSPAARSGTRSSSSRWRASS